MNFFSREIIELDFITIKAIFLHFKSLTLSFWDVMPQILRQLTSHRLFSRIKVWNLLSRLKLYCWWTGTQLNNSVLSSCRSAGAAKLLTSRLPRKFDPRLKCSVLSKTARIRVLLHWKVIFSSLVQSAICFSERSWCVWRFTCKKQEWRLNSKFQNPQRTCHLPTSLLHKS